MTTTTITGSVAGIRAAATWRHVMAGRVVPIQLTVPKADGPSTDVVYFELTDVQVVGGTHDWHDISSDEVAPVEKAGASLDRAVAAVEPIIAQIAARVAAMKAAKPQEIEISIGVKLSAKVGFFVAESQGEGSIGLKLKYQITSGDGNA